MNEILLLEKLQSALMKRSEYLTTANDGCEESARILNEIALVILGVAEDLKETAPRQEPDPQPHPQEPPFLPDGILSQAKDPHPFPPPPMTPR